MESQFKNSTIKRAFQVQSQSIEPMAMKIQGL
jgi:hypothetical protein